MPESGGDDIVAITGLEQSGETHVRDLSGTVVRYPRCQRVETCSTGHALTIGSILRAKDRSTDSLTAGRSCGCVWRFSGAEAN